MALINHAKREINVKIVYYGCDGVGKSTSMRYIYDRIKPTLRGDLKSMPTSGGSLFFFDFSPFETPVFGGYRVRFHIYTLHGKVANPAAWKMTLKGADGLVLMADGASERLSVERDAIQSLRNFLSSYGIGLHDIPTVLQLNPLNRVGSSSPEDAAVALDLTGTPVGTSAAVTGEGVLEILTTLSRAIMKRVGQDDSFSQSVIDEPRQESQHLTAELSEVEQPVQEAEAKQDAACQEDLDLLQVRLTTDGVVCLDGIVRIPLELEIGGVMRRLLVSVAIEQVDLNPNQVPDPGLELSL